MPVQDTVKTEKRLHYIFAVMYSNYQGENK